MPKKRTRAAVRREEEEQQDESHETEPAPPVPQTPVSQSESELPKAKRRHADASASTTSEEATQGLTEDSTQIADTTTAAPTAPPIPSKLAAQMERLAKLKAMRSESQQANRNEVKIEHRKTFDNPKEAIRNEKRRKEAEILLMRQEVESQGIDYERARAMEYSVESVERWDRKQREKAKRVEGGFTDANQMAAKKYKKQIKDLKPNLSTYAERRAVHAPSAGGQVDDGFYRGADSLAYAGVDSTPTPGAVERVVRDLEKQMETRSKFSRRRAFNEDDDVTYVNERNMNFNKKISRAYDKYTTEIRASFERGTAL
ncbi:hypothetical protein HDV00_009163 [Rhizophlyctis rosea]|nr:hypothetical protein HDV00_009163 [Rhizophlyctis rosea]